MKFMDNTTVYTYLNNALTEIKGEIQRKYFVLKYVFDMAICEPNILDDVLVKSLLIVNQFRFKWKKETRYQYPTRSAEKVKGQTYDGS